jgi:hypothetical protein
MIWGSVEPKSPIDEDHIENPRQQWACHRAPDNPSPESATSSLSGLPNKESAYQANWEIKNIKNAVVHWFPFPYGRIINIVESE